MEMTPIAMLNVMSPMEKMTSMNAGEKQIAAINTEDASFLDIFRGMVNNVIETNEQVDRDAIDLMLGNIDDLAQVEANIQKASVAVDLLVTVKNEVLSAYNSIINMQV
ncbi:MAG: flagellar hook-basal body complex protein FliE [Oscillospiraceae bacterium]|nr:flagellar hook-basal body complex protein FliE [Oscillospiraceae bacterium]